MTERKFEIRSKKSETDSNIGLGDGRGGTRGGRDRIRPAKKGGWRIGEVVKRALEGQEAFSANPLGDWKELVGEQVACYSRPESLKKKRLLVVVHDSVWKHHLEINKELILDRINGGRREPLVERISIKVGDILSAHPELNPNYKKLRKLKAKKMRPSGKKASKRPLTPEEKAFLEGLPDAELRRLGARLLKLTPLEE